MSLNHLGLQLVAFLSSTAGAPAEDGGAGQLRAGIVYGEGHAFAVTAPQGWVLDNQSGARAGLYAVFYPEGSSWKAAPAAMYVNTARKQPPQISVGSFIEEDLQRFRANGSDVKMSVAPPVTTSDKKRAEVRYFSGDKWDNHEAVAYIEEDELFVLIVLTGRTKAAYEASVDAFRELVSSYRFLTKAVSIDH